MTRLACWTCTSTETQPRVRRRGEDAADLTLLVGTTSPDGAEPDVQVQVEVTDGQRWTASPITRTTLLDRAELNRRFAERDDYRRLEATRHLADLRDRLAVRPQQHYYEVLVEDLPYGELARVTVTASMPGLAGEQHQEVTAVRLVDPVFTGNDVRHANTPDHPVNGRPVAASASWWVLMVQEDAQAGFDHVRLDLLYTHDPAGQERAELAPITLVLDDRPISLRARPPAPHGAMVDGEARDGIWPLVDRSTDSVVVSVPRRGGERLRSVTVHTQGHDDAGVFREDQTVVAFEEEPGLGADPPWAYGPSGLMIIHYCIQGAFNDLFTAPSDTYAPPRSFIQLAYADERAVFSGMPTLKENGIPDGYRYSLLAQQAYAIPTTWAFNAGVLALLRHGLTEEDWQFLVRQVADGLVRPANAGFGAHRPPYYARETNVQEIVRCGAMLARYFPDLPYEPSLYFPDQRIFQGRPDSEVAAYIELRQQHGLRYLVADRSTAATDDRRLFVDERVEDGNYLWHEERTGLGLLLIEDRLRDTFLNAASWEVSRGQLHPDLKRLFMKAVRRPAADVPRLYVMGDDADHYCGDGWFDGKPDPFHLAYLSALCWVRHHPWVDAGTTEDPDFAARYRSAKPEQARRLRLTDAICPSVDPGGISTVDPAGNRRHFDTWYQWWAETRSAWLDLSLRSLSDRLEDALLRWPAEYRNDMWDLAWMAFLAGTHESMWSKQPVTPEMNSDTRTWEPEDFVVSESIQLRNAWVYLNAALWQKWAEDSGGADPGPTFVLAPETTDPDDPRAEAGPLRALLLAAGSADPYWWGDAAPGAQRGIYFDADCLPTYVLYNRQVLVVLDQNGGAVTHVFFRTAEDPAVSVSGTFKTHQFVTLEPKEIPCDGHRIQNTVSTPNHRYLAGDVVQTRPGMGSFTDPRVSEPLPTWIPNQFDRYTCSVEAGDTVGCVYDHTEDTPSHPVAQEEFIDWCRRDGQALRAGRTGIVWHPGASFSKTIRLEGTRIHVAYRGVRPEHEVSNEFALDFGAAVREGAGQTKEVGEGTLTLSGHRGRQVRISALAGCDFTEAARLPAMPTGDPEPVDLAAAYGELHRVMTANLRIRCTGEAETNDFGYVIDLA